MKNLKSSKYPNVWQTIDQIRSNLDLQQSEIAEILRLPLPQFNKMKSNERPLSLFSATSLVENFNLTWEAFVYNRIDYRALIEHHSGNLGYVPDRYLLGAYSKRRTVSGFLDFIEHYRGPSFRNKVLRHFQIQEAALANGSDPINIIFMQELLSFLRGNHFVDSDFIELGAFSAVANRGTQLHQSLLMTNSVQEAYEHLIVDLVRYYEHNCDYRMMKLTDTNCVVESTPSKVLVDTYKNWKVGSREICLGRVGILASIPSYLNQLNSKVTETKCIHHGDQVCTFEVKYNKTRRSSSQHSEIYQ